jgi:2,4-dienoyl-CoA reductase-like NADH-dependent reductase (Old Yellow Enzyme family)
MLSIIDAFIGAVVPARKASFNEVQLHAAHGYLMSEFVLLKRNRWKDKWGGTIENRSPPRTFWYKESLA